MKNVVGELKLWIRVLKPCISTLGLSSLPVKYFSIAIVLLCGLSLQAQHPICYQIGETDGLPSQEVYQLETFAKLN